MKASSPLYEWEEALFLPAFLTEKTDIAFLDALDYSMKQTGDIRFPILQGSPSYNILENG